MIGTDPHSLDEVKETMKCFENDRHQQFYDLQKLIITLFQPVLANFK
ncbi:4664_t:CDS:1, partial [Funneliformis mosseae]